MEQHYLYVEDDPMSREIMRIIIENGVGSPNLTVFEDSTDFLGRVGRLNNPPTIILLDIHVTPYDGFQMLAMLRQSDQFSTTKIIALTASVMNEEVEQLREAGFDGAIAKPLSIQTFPQLLKQVENGETIWHIS
ncbi:MAG: response regulator [bacterium]|nr:response regulator [bacterium]